MITDFSFTERVARNISQARMKKHWSRELLAEKLNMTRTRVHQLESGAAPITTATIEKVAFALGVDPGALAAR